MFFSSFLKNLIYFSILLEETLLDDLLNFAATPKGLLLLQNTGTVNECVTFMFNRFAKNLQVGKIRFEKLLLIIKLEYKLMQCFDCFA